jgi:uncharacterized protein YuzE
LQVSRHVQADLAGDPGLRSAPSGLRFAATEEAGPFIYDVDTEGRIIGIEILSCSKVLAPGEWQKARMPSGRGRSADGAE